MAQVSLQTVSNDTFPAVRANLNAQLAALYSNNSGNTAPVNPAPYQFWADTTANLLKMRNAANSAWITVGPLETTNLGLALASGGTLNNPSVTGGTFSSPGLTGTPTCPTAAAGTNTTQVASTAFVNNSLVGVLVNCSGNLTVANGVAAPFGPPVSMTVQRNTGFTVNTSTGEMTIPSSGAYLFTSSSLHYFALGTGIKDALGYGGFMLGSGTNLSAPSRITWPSAYGDSTTQPITATSVILINAAAGQVVRPVYLSLTAANATVGVITPGSFSLNRLF